MAFLGPENKVHIFVYDTIIISMCISIIFMHMHITCSDRYVFLYKVAAVLDIFTDQCERRLEAKYTKKYFFGF